MAYHRQTLDNIADASRRTRKLCAVMLDTLGREILVRRNATIGPDGWPVHEETMKVTCGQKVSLSNQSRMLRS
jgi:pyruvate kinase